MAAIRRLAKAGDRIKAARWLKRPSRNLDATSPANRVSRVD